MNNEKIFDGSSPETTPSGKKKDKKNGKKKFVVLDVVIIAVLVIAITLVVVVYSPLELFGGGEKSQITFTVEIKGVDPRIASGISVGDPVSVGSYSFGTVASAVEAEPYREYYYDDESGEVNYIEHPDLADLLIVITADADSDEIKGFSVNGIRIAVGAGYELIMPGFTGHGICSGIIENQTSEGGGA